MNFYVYMKTTYSKHGKIIGIGAETKNKLDRVDGMATSEVTPVTIG